MLSCLQKIMLYPPFLFRAMADDGNTHLWVRKSLEDLLHADSNINIFGAGAFLPKTDQGGCYITSEMALALTARARSSRVAP